MLEILFEWEGLIHITKPFLVFSQDKTASPILEELTLPNSLSAKATYHESVCILMLP
jgi:hypothetical protein